MGKFRFATGARQKIKPHGEPLLIGAALMFAVLVFSLSSVVGEGILGVGFGDHSLREGVDLSGLGPWE